MTDFTTHKIVDSESGVLLKDCDHRSSITDQTHCFSCQHPKVTSLNGLVTPEICFACSLQYQKPQTSLYENPKAIHVTLTTYNRALMLKDVLDDIYKTGEDYHLMVDVFDDGTSDDLSFLSRYPLLRHFRRHQNGGVPAYCYLIQFAFKQLSSIDADYHFFLPDDVRLVPEF
ncbi:glycosyltransferase, partial [uncultured Gimesia sp.]|uniref:glycosyltransferase family 2 protein n=1 Tax=uncultured Gimesia sp. TaxID=1678688 RepID=UPI00262FDE0F